MPDDDPLEIRARARVGHVLNEKWTLERLLGVGGMAAVYAGRHRNGAKAAVKVLHAELAVDKEVRERFLHEGKAANRVDHPGAVQVLDDDVVREGEDAGAAYIVMELLDGESVLDRARRNAAPLEESEVLAISESVLETLAAAHEHGIVHRDLKPENLFLARSAPTRTSLVPGNDPIRADDEHIRVKVLDFGIARIADGGGKTRIGTTLGTPTYMAPEQAQGKRDQIDGRTDLFALGATMYRLLTGARIHDAPSSAEILAKMATVPAAPIRRIAPHLSVAIATIVDRALRFYQTDRYADARAMLADVVAARRGASLPSYAETAAARTPGEFGPSSDDPTHGLPFLEPAHTVVARGGRAGSPAAAPTPPASAQEARTVAHRAPPPEAQQSPLAVSIMTQVPTTHDAGVSVAPARAAHPALGLPPTVVSNVVPTAQPPMPVISTAAVSAPVASSPGRSSRPPLALFVAVGIVACAILAGLAAFALRSPPEPPARPTARSADSTDQDRSEPAASDDDRPSSDKTPDDERGSDVDDAGLAPLRSAVPGTTAPRTKAPVPTTSARSAVKGDAPIVIALPTNKPSAIVAPTPATATGAATPVPTASAKKPANGKKTK